VACDAHQLPFQANSFGGIILLDVVHHLVRPMKFFAEAVRVLKPGGRLVMIEPGMSPIAYPFYRYIHQEPAEMNVDPFEEPPSDFRRSPWDSNQDIPTLLFDNERNRAEVLRRFPMFSIREIDWFSLFAYPLSGGFKRWSLVPDAAVDPIIKLEDALPRAIRRFFGFRLIVTLEKSC